MKAEIDALQISAAERSRPWWKQASSWLAILALFVTAATAIQQDRLQHAQTDQDRKQGTIAAEAELSTVMTHIESMEREQITLAKLPASKRTQAQVILNAQSLVWIEKGTNLVDRRTHVAGAAEYYALAQAIMSQIGANDKVIEYLVRALKLARDERTYALAAQVLADAHTRRGEPAAADEAFALAVAPPPALAEAAARVAVLNDASYAHILWAAALRIRGQCAARRVHVRLAAELIKEEQDAGFAAPTQDNLKVEESAACPSGQVQPSLTPPATPTSN